MNVERDPTKRQVKPAQNLFDFDDLGESSDDSDFRIEDHCEDSDDDSIDSDSGKEGKGGGSDSDDDDEEDSDASDADENEVVGLSIDKPTVVEDVLTKAKEHKQLNIKDSDKIKIAICCVCLGDRSDATNEIVECDGCGVTVHEGCYGVSENDSVSSTVSSCSTMPWFCEACRAGVESPTCELCPNSGGIFKETDVGKWVHLVCALYIPGVAFGEVDKLGSVTLFEMAYSKWGTKACQLCPDKRLAHTGVAIGCDAGMCRNYFHVTCGQSNGLLAEAHSEEVDQADPFYAHCKLHSDKTLVRKRRRNWLALQLRTAQYKEQCSKEQHINSNQQVRIHRKLDKYKIKYLSAKKTRTPPWVPTQKMGRLLTTSASACRALWRKAELSGVDIEAWEIREAQVAALADVHRKWYIPPAFSVEFIGYYLDRNLRVSSMRRQLAELLDENSRLVEEQKTLQDKYNKAVEESSKENMLNQSLKDTLQMIHSTILKVAPNKRLPNLDLLGRNVLYPPPTAIQSQTASVRNHPLATPSGGVPTAAALKAGVGFPLGLRQSGIVNKVSSRSDVPLNNECGICRRNTDQHLLAKCDTCHHYYHLGCLNPPLTRMPKKNKIMGWQCSECDKDSSGSEVECLDPEAPRKLRHVKDNGDGVKIVKSDNEKSNTSIEEAKQSVDPELIELSDDLQIVESNQDIITGRPGKKRRREKHRRYSPEPLGSTQSSSRPHKRKRKHKSLDNTFSSGTANTSSTSISDNEPRQSLKICFKSIPHPTGEGSAYVATPSHGVTRTITPTPTMPMMQITSSTTTAAVTHSVQQQLQELDESQGLMHVRTLAAKKKEEPASVCSTCNTLGTASNLVRCDECLKGFHFHCLDPPVKKSPKVRGYSWHCADCDPTESDSS